MHLEKIEGRNLWITLDDDTSTMTGPYDSPEAAMDAMHMAAHEINKQDIEDHCDEIVGRIESWGPRSTPVVAAMLRVILKEDMGHRFWTEVIRLDSGQLDAAAKAIEALRRANPIRVVLSGPEVTPEVTPCPGNP